MARNVYTKEEYQNFLIVDIFKEKRFRLFHEFCKERNFKVLADFKKFDFADLFLISGYGTKSKRIIFERMRQYGIYRDEDVLRIHGSNYNLPLTALHVLKLSEIHLRYLESKDCIYVKDLLKLSFEDMLFDMRVTMYRKIVGILKLLEYDIMDILLKIIGNMDERTLNIMSRRANGERLARIAEDEDMSTEGIRKNIMMNVTILEPYISEIIKAVMKKSKKIEIKANEVLDVFQLDDCDDVLLYALKKSVDFEYKKKENSYFLRD